MCVRGGICLLAHCLVEIELFRFVSFSYSYLFCVCFSFAIFFFDLAVCFFFFLFRCLARYQCWRSSDEMAPSTVRICSICSRGETVPNYGKQIERSATMKSSAPCVYLCVHPSKNNVAYYSHSLLGVASCCLSLSMYLCICTRLRYFLRL